ncbi:MAG TPA: exosortase-associated EpsI family protein [Phycisphaerae bacterium]|nr:exosortase-associated EpsI family protein [Phycisphaerae bacterium]
MSTALDGLKSAFSRATFVVCAVILLLSAIGLEATVRFLGLEFRKRPVPLQQPFRQFDFAQLGPEYRLEETHAISAEGLQELGTDEYLSCTLRDTRRPPSDPLSRVNVLITYYTGDPDQVPHVPDVCYLGGGFQQLGSKKLSLTVPELGPAGENIPVRQLKFGKQVFGARQEAMVLYLFSANGQYECDRERLRLILGNPFARYAYFSKVELSFAAAHDADRSGPLGLEALAKLLPVLVRDHWPHWQKVGGRSDAPARGLDG